MMSISKLSKPINLQFDWCDIIAFVIFFVYGFHGAIIGQEYPVISIVFTFVSALLFILFLLLPYKTARLKRQISFTLLDISFFLFYLASILIISYRSLTFDIAIDQLYHSYWAIVQSINIVELLSREVNGIGDLSFKDIARLVNLLLLGMMAGVIYLIRKKKAYTIILLVILFLVFRWFVYNTSGGTSPHPQFRLFPIWISSSLFGINNIAFQLSSIFGLALLMMQVHMFLEKKIPLPLTMITVLSCGTIPVLLHTGTIVEPSIWASLFVTFLLIQLYDKKPEQLDLVNLMSLLTMFFLMRQSVVACLGTLILILLLQVKKVPTGKYKSFILPFLLLLPMSFIFFKSLYVGTPGSVERLSADPTLVRVWTSLVSGISLQIVTASFHLPLLFFFLLAFIPWRKEEISSSLLIVFTFLFLYFIFFSANTHYWGSGRYLAEFVVPFIILGILKFVLLINKKRYLIIAGLLALGVLYIYHVYSFINLKSYSKDIAISYPAPKKVRTVISEDINNYSEVLSCLKKESAGSRVLFADEWIYYNLPFIIHDFTVRDCMVQKDYIKNYVAEKEFELSDLKYVENNINYIVIDPFYKGNGKSVEQLKQLGWLKVPMNFKHSRYILLYKNNL